MSSDLASRARTIIDNQVYITVATVTADGKPWNTPVFVVHDEQYNFIWSSWSGAEHSKNIRQNPDVFIVMFDSSRQRGDNHRQGVYLQATATQLESVTEVSGALRHFKGVGDQKPTPDDFLDHSSKRLYRARPEKLWLNDLSESQVTGDTVKMRVEVPLSSV